MTINPFHPAALAALFLLAATSAGRAENVSLVAHLLGGSAVPANKSDAFGEAQFTYDTTTRQLDYYVTYDDAAPTQIDLHGPAGVGEKAPSVVVFAVSGSPVTGKATLTPDQGTALLSGKMYVDIHSGAYGDGEIRGQIKPQ